MTTLIKRLVLCTALACAAGAMGFGAQAAAGPVKVTRLVPAQPSQVAPAKVSVLIFFDFKPASRALFQRLASWAGIAGSRVVLGREPLVGSDKAPLARAFMVARTLGVTETVLPALFDLAASRPDSAQAGQDASPLKPAIADIFKSAGINKIEFMAAWQSGAAHAGLLHARTMAERFQAHASPLVIVNGSWKLAPSAGASADEVIAALNREVNQAQSRITAE